MTFNSMDLLLYNMNLKVFIFLTFTCLMKLVDANLNLPLVNTALDHKLYEDVLDAEECHRQIMFLRSFTLLTMQFADAGIRIPRGLMNGNSLDMGNYHQCLGYNYIVGDMDVQGKYCTIRVPMNQTFQIPQTDSMWDLSVLNSLNISEGVIREYEDYDLARSQLDTLVGLSGEDQIRTLPVGPLVGTVLRLAVCIPRPCTTDQAMTSFLFNLTSVGFRYTDDFCRLPDDKPWVPADYIVIVLFSIIGFLTALSTTYDLVCTFVFKQDRKTLNRAYQSFSVYTNGKRLAAMSSGSDNLQCLDGIRVLAMLWIIVGHTFSSEKFAVNGFEVFSWMISMKALWITSATISVDTFFTLGGVLLVYTTAAKMNSATLIKNLHLFYLNRILRMLPLLGTAVLVQASLFNRISDGPFWTTVARQTNLCRTYWWSTLLHLQNLLNPANMCIPHSWYIAIDVHVYFVSPLVLYWVLSGRKMSAWVALILSLLITMTAAGIYNYTQNFPAGTVVFSRPGADMAHFMNYYYFNTLTRASPVFVGMIIGYVLHLNRNKKVYIPWLVVVLLWICTLSMTTLIFFSTYFIKQLDWDNVLVDNLMNTFMRPTWGVCLGWIIFSSVHGYGGPANWLLSLDLWKIPARISYAMFIFHYPMMFVYYDSMISTSYFSVARITFIAFAHISLTLIVSYILTVLIDSPFSALFKLLLEKKRIQPARIDKQNVKVDNYEADIKHESNNDTEEFDRNRKGENINDLGSDKLVNIRVSSCSETDNNKIKNNRVDTNVIDDNVTSESDISKNNP